MAITDFLGNLSSSNYLAIGGSVIGIVVIIIIVISFRRRRAEWGSYSERALEREEGLGALARAERGVERAEEAAQKQEKALESAESVEGGKSKDESTKKADEAVKEGAEASEHEEAAEEATAAVEGRGMGIEAAIKKITRAIIEYAYKKKNNVLTEEQEALVLDDILKKIRNTVNYNVIDERINNYLRQFLDQLVSAFQHDIETEEKKEELIGNLVKEMENAVSIMKTSINGARIELNKLRREERKTRKHFKKELSDLRASLKAKVKELRKLNSRNADPGVVASLRSEIDLRSQQLANAKNVNKQLEATYDFMKSEIRQMKKLLKYVLKNERDIKSYDKSLESRKKEINKRFKDLREVVSLIEKVAEKFKIANPHEVALVLSTQLKNYFKIYSRILEEDLSFDNTVKDITIKNFVISQQMDAFQQLTTALTQSEEAIESGVQALTELIGGIVGEASKTNVAGVVQILQKARKILDYEQGIEAFMKNLAQTLKNKSRQVNADIQLIIEEDKKLLTQIKAEEESTSSHLGSVMATAVQRKIEINQKYMTQANAFGQQLEQRNAIAANAYKQAIRTESIAAAA